MIAKLNAQGPQPKGTRLFSLDAIDMYPSIPTERAPAWVREQCLKFGYSAELVDWLIKAIEFMLRSNTFEYDSELFCQKTGTAIGAPFSCAYAGCSM